MEINRWGDGVFKEEREYYEVLKRDVEYEIRSIVGIIKLNDHH